ncbi:MAG TPA: hypothetical protein DD666_07415 [Advenella kashmirensis]|uniref:Uncharacterized protein n=1 Tax=Advenella kashmirensis TaxID=310575 RepID=A0A356LEN7_9BURK|nr:hypothetical protein [Advenella kashmirensis]
MAFARKKTAALTRVLLQEKVSTYIGQAVLVRSLQQDLFFIWQAPSLNRRFRKKASGAKGGGNPLYLNNPFT